VPVSAVVTDPDGGTVRALFRYSMDSFASYTDIYSAYVTSGGTATATLTGLDTNTFYQMYVYAQDLQGQYSNSSAYTEFYTNRTPNAPTIVQPGVNANLDSTIDQKFIWTFSDPDPADSQTSASFRYRQSGTTTWTYATDPGTVQFVTIPANTFTPNVVYEWQVSTSDEQAVAGPYTSSNFFIASSPQVFASVVAGMSLAPLQTESIPLSLQAVALMPVSALDTIATSMNLSSIAAMGLVPLSTIKIVQALAAVTSMNYVTAQTLPYASSMVALASLIESGTKTIDSSSLAIAVKAAFAIQVTLGADAMAAQASMAVTSGPITLQPSLLLAARAAIVTAGQASGQANLSMAIHAVLSSTGVESRTVPLTMVTHGSLSQTGHVLLDPDPDLLVTARMSLAGFSQPSAPIVIHALAHMVQSGQLRKDSVVSFVAHAGILISSTTGQTFAIVPMLAEAALDVVGEDDQTAGILSMLAIANLSMKDQQVVYEGAYLVVQGPNGSTMSFGATSYPTPRKIRNVPFAESTGNVLP
jgi:hypothetical protein